MVERFWSKVKIGASDECWPWQACVDKKGYGKFSIRRSQHTGAHRVAFALATGVDPRDLCILHRCDNPPCCNPAHLFLGTVADNNRDMHTKGRHSRHVGENVGELNPAAKLSADDVRAIRAARAGGETFVSMASRYGVTEGCIAHAVKGLTWQTVM